MKRSFLDRSPLVVISNKPTLRRTLRIAGLRRRRPLAFSTRISDSIGHDTGHLEQRILPFSEPFHTHPLYPQQILFSDSNVLQDPLKNQAVNICSQPTSIQPTTARGE